MKWFSITMVMVLLIVGCTRVVIVDRNITVERIVYNNTIEYINNTIIEPCNLTCPALEDCHSSGFNREYTLSLIRRVKFLEGREDLYWNDTECHYDLNRTEAKLEECEEELCGNWNSSWC